MDDEINRDPKKGYASFMVGEGPTRIYFYVFTDPVAVRKEMIPFWKGSFPEIAEWWAGGTLAFRVNSQMIFLRDTE